MNYLRLVYICLFCLMTMTLSSNLYAIPSIGWDAPIGDLNSVFLKANIFVQDLREPIGDDPLAGFIGSIATNRQILSNHKKDKLGSGAFTISPCHVLAARHSVFGDEDADSENFTVTLTIGQLGSNEFFTLAAKPILWGPDNVNGNDWVILHVERCIGVVKTIGWIKLAKAEEKLNVTLTGIQGDKKFGSIWTSPCRLRSESIDHLYLHDCPTRGGSSGDPIYTFDADGVPQLRALNIGSVIDLPGIRKSYLDNEANVAIDAGYLNDKIEKIIQKNVSWFAQNFPGEVNPQIELARKYNINRKYK